jgi:hypothetical protein
MRKLVVSEFVTLDSRRGCAQLRHPLKHRSSGRASRFLADLRLGSLNLEGAASRLEVVLAAPSGAAIVIILGDASNVVIRRPKA